MIILLLIVKCLCKLNVSALTKPIPSFSMNLFIKLMPGLGNYIMFFTFSGHNTELQFFKVNNFTNRRQRGNISFN